MVIFDKEGEPGLNRPGSVPEAIAMEFHRTDADHAMEESKVAHLIPDRYASFALNASCALEKAQRAFGDRRDSSQRHS